MAHGRYTVVRKLAEGGMAEIFLARQHGSEGFEKPVVLKRIHTAFYADEQFRNMLVDEAHISMGLHHNNIVQVLDLGRAGGRLFLVLELVDGWDLARVLDRAETAQWRLPAGIGLYVMAEVCRALSYAHSRTRPDGEPMGIVHRDVSPQNVLISEQGEVKLADFGIAKALTRRDRTATGVVKGKVAFMSPEQAHGQPIDARSDLFSLGTLLYLTTTGQRPFEAATDFEVIARVQKCLYRPPEEVSPDMPASLSAIIRRALALDRDQRYRTADELLVDLESVWRAEYGAPGQTELKLWLADLARVDGSAPTGRTGVFGPGRNGTPGDLAEGAALVLGDEGSERGRTVRVGEGKRSGDTEDTALAVVGLPEIGALEVSLPDGSTRPERRRRGTSRSAVSGIEATAMSDLSLRLGDGDEEVIDRLRGRTRRRVVGTGFLVFVLLGGGVTAGLWRLATARRATGTADPGAEGSAAPITEPPAAKAALPAPPAPARRQPSPRAETRTEAKAAAVRPPSTTLEAQAAEAAEAAEREAEREADRRRARELRWSLPSDDGSTAGGSRWRPLPRPTAPGELQGAGQVAPPAPVETPPAPAPTPPEETTPPAVTPPAGERQPPAEPDKPTDPPVNLDPPPPVEEPPAGAAKPETTP